MNILKQISAVAVAAMANIMAVAQPSSYVDPMIGTDGMGHTFPGP